MYHREANPQNVDKKKSKLEVFEIKMKNEKK